LGRRAAASDRIFVDGNTMRAMKTAIIKLPLPATLMAVCLALRNNDAVLADHADAEFSRLNDDDNAMRQFEIMGSSFGGMSLSPAQKLEKRTDDFKGACQSLVAGGTGVMMNSWEEVKEALSEIFTFAKVDIEASSGSQRQATAAGGGLPALSRRRHQPSPKRTLKKAHNRSPMKPPRAKMTSRKSISEKFLTLDAYRAKIRRGMGAMAFRRIFQQGEILASKPAISSDEAAAARLDEQIKQKEAERRSSLEVAEILAAKEKANKEREAKESASKLMRPLTTEEQSVVNNAIRGIGPEGEILARQDADSVQRGSMQTLRRGQWINDEIINYFLKNCLAKRDEKLCAKQPGRKRSHFFNSFFVQTMFDEKNNNDRLRGKYNYKNVKRWGKKVPGKDVFNLRYVVCPINLDNLHWTSAVIFVEEKRIQYYDSMGGTDWKKLEGLLQYLKDEYRAKKGEELDADEWELVACTRDTPRQRNGFDCGVFTCMFCDFISKDCPLVFNQDHIDQCRDRIALSIMKNCAIE